MEIFLDPARRRGVTGELYEQLREAIVSGRLPDGELVPPSRELARDLGVSRHTVTSVYGRLVAEGYLTGRAGGGTQVTYGSVATGRRRRPSELCPLPLPDTEYVTPPPPPGGVDLRIGLPDRGLFPVTAWRRSIVTAAQVAPAAGGEPAGDPGLRSSIARWIGRSRGIDVDADDVVITNGAQHAVDLLARVFVLPGDRVAYEEPGYAPIRDSLATCGAEIVPIPVDDDGIVVDAIPADVRLVYVTPSHQSPSGATMSLARRRALLDLADRHQMAIVEDDYDSEYRLVDRPLEPLYRLDRHGRVVYVGTFSKTLSPTLRLGFAALPSALSAAVARAAELSGAHPPTIVQEALHHFIADGHLDRHLRHARRVYAERQSVVTSFVDRMVDDGLLAPGPASHAGLHLSARLPTGVLEADVVERCNRRDVVLTSSAHSWIGAPTRQVLLIGFGRSDPSTLERGLAVVHDVLRATAVTADR